MHTLNLAYPEKGDVQYKKLSFPDGQQDIVITGYDDNGTDLEIFSRMNSFLDVELITCAVKAWENTGGFGRGEIHLTIPYLLGGRSDRTFVDGGNNYLRDIIAPAINRLDLNSVEILDAHSDVTEAVIDNYVPMDIDFPSWVIGKLGSNHPDLNINLRIISPDAGALKKIYKIAKDIEYDGDIIVASKHREVSTGKILSTEVPLKSQDADKAFVIFDDICDGGRTFIEIAKIIRQKWPDAFIYLAVSHGIFSQGFTELSKYITHIYTTNSIRDLAKERHESPMADMTQTDINNFVTQLDVL